MLAAAVSVAAPSSAPTSHSPAADTVASLLSSMLSSVSLSLRTSSWLYSSLPSRCRAPTGLRAAIGDGARYLTMIFHGAADGMLEGGVRKVASSRAC